MFTCNQSSREERARDSACCASAFTVALARCFLYQPNSLEEKTMAFICLLSVVRVCWDVQTINRCFVSGCYRIAPGGQKWSWELNPWQNVKRQKRISCIRVSDTYFSELEHLNWPNDGKWTQVIFVKTEIIDDRLVSDPLIIWDPSMKLWKGRLASAAHSVKLCLLRRILYKLIHGLIWYFLVNICYHRAASGPFTDMTLIKENVPFPTYNPLKK